MRYTNQISTQLGFRAPTLAGFEDCPLCGKVRALEVQGATRLHCGACRFFGTLLDLYALTSGQSLVAALQDLRGKRLLEVSEEELADLKARMARQEAARRHQAEHSRRLQVDSPTSIRGIFQAREIPYTDRDIYRLAPYCVASQARDMEGLIPSWARTRMGRPMWLGITCFEGAVITGYWMVGPEEHFYAPLIDEEARAGLGFGLQATSAREGCLLLENPVAALRVQLRALTDEQELLPCLVPSRWPFGPELADLAGPLYYWSGPEAVQLREALKVDRIATVPAHLFPDPTRELPGGTIRGFLEQLPRVALEPARALVLALGGQSVQEARKALVACGLTEPERERLVRACTDEHLQGVLEALQGARETPRIPWGTGRSIEETQAGWTSKGRIVSQVVLRLETIRSDGRSGGLVTGYWRYREHRQPFEVQLGVLRVRTGKWLHDQVLNHLGASPIIDPAYSNKLFDIAQLFHEPLAPQRAERAGWSGPQGEQVLRFPRFAIDRQGVHPGDHPVIGPLIQVPAALSAPELEGFRDPGTCEVTLALLGNLVRQSRGERPRGLVYRLNGFAVDRIAQALGVPTATLPGELGPQTGLGCPLPVPCRGDGPATRALLDPQGAPHALLGVEPVTFEALGLYPHWLRLTRPPPTDYRTLRAALLACPGALQAQVSDLAFYRDLAQVIKDQFPGLQGTNRLHHTAGLMDTPVDPARQLLGMAWRAEHLGALLVARQGGEVEFTWGHLLRAYSKSLVDLPGFDQACRWLLDGGQLVRANPLPGLPGGRITLREDAWGLAGALAGAL